MKKLFGLLALLFLAAGTLAQAQQIKKIPKIGVLSTGSASSETARNEAFLQGLRELGYVVGQNILIEHRYAEAKPDRLPELAAELVRLKVDVIVAGALAIGAAKNATKTIPIVMATSGDPVAYGYVVSLAQPGRQRHGIEPNVPGARGEKTGATEGVP